MTDIGELYEECPHGHWICKKCGKANHYENEHKMRRHVREEHLQQTKLAEVTGQ